jgi:O-acetyl-ADP-ribose deacetylase (regulator of RNase III)
MAVTHITGNLLDPTHAFDAIVHGCNLKGVMGAGIAKTISSEWPDILPPYKAACADGTFVLGSVLPFAAGDGLTVLNWGTQVAPGPDARLEAVSAAAETSFQMAVDYGWTKIGIPQVGCGIGGLDWDVVSQEITDIASDFPELDIVLVTFG